MSEHAAPARVRQTAAAPQPGSKSELRLQRKCACGRHTADGAECGACAKKRATLQRWSASHPSPAMMLRTAGRAERAGASDDGARRGRDFIHVGTGGAATAERAVGNTRWLGSALAATVAGIAPPGAAARTRAARAARLRDTYPSDSRGRAWSTESIDCERPAEVPQLERDATRSPAESPASAAGEAPSTASHASTAASPAAAEAATTGSGAATPGPLPAMAATTAPAPARRAAPASSRPARTADAAAEPEDGEELVMEEDRDAPAPPLAGSPARRTRPLAPPIVHEVLRSPGRGLDSSTRGFMEPRFERNFSGVRVHADPQAARSAASVDAEAYAVGRHIVFGAGRFAPATPAGLRLLAHELAHVSTGDPPTHEDLEIGPRESAEERAAERAAERVARGAGVGALAPAAGLVLRRQSLPAVFGTMGAVVGAAVGVLGGPLGALLGAGIGLAVGLLVGVIANAVRGGSPQGADPHTYWATLAKVPLSATPTEEKPGAGPELPADTRVVIVESSYGDWVKVRVTTGPSLGVEGWVACSALEERRNTAEVTPESAVQLFAELAQARFKTTGGKDAPIPFHYPPDGCYARAEYMADLLREKGYEPQKVFAVSRKKLAGVGLKVRTPYAGDVPEGDEPAVRWWYHVAPIIKVRGADGTLADIVIDPSLMDEPGTIDQWTSRMSDEQFLRRSLDEVRELVSADGEYPVGNPMTFITPASVYQLPGTGSTWTPPRQVDADTRQKMTTNAGKARTHELAAAIRGLLAGKPVDVDALVATISAAPAESRHDLRKHWGGLMDSLRGLLSPEEYQRVFTALGTP
jgi:hypothetical protein